MAREDRFIDLALRTKNKRALQAKAISLENQLRILVKKMEQVEKAKNMI